MVSMIIVDYYYTRALGWRKLTQPESPHHENIFIDLECSGIYS